MLLSLRNALCPPPDIGSLLLALQTGTLRLRDSPRKRQPQIAGLRALIPRWIA